MEGETYGEAEPPLETWSEPMGPDPVPTVLRACARTSSSISNASAYICGELRGFVEREGVSVCAREQKIVRKGCQGHVLDPDLVRDGRALETLSVLVHHLDFPRVVEPSTFSL